MYKGNWIHPSDNVMIDFSKLRIYGTLIHRHQALGQDKTWFDSRRQMWIRQQNNEKNQKKFHGKLKSHIKLGRRAACPMTPVSNLFFPTIFLLVFFFMLSTFEFVLFFFFFLGIKKIKHWISDMSLDSWLSTKHRLKSNLILSLFLRWLESSIYNWAGLKLLCPQGKKKIIIKSIEVQSIVIFKYNVCPRVIQKKITVVLARFD